MRAKVKERRYDKTDIVAVGRLHIHCTTRRKFDKNYSRRTQIDVIRLADRDCGASGDMFARNRISLNLASLGRGIDHR